MIFFKEGKKGEGAEGGGGGGVLVANPAAGLSCQVINRGYKVS